MNATLTIPIGKKLRSALKKRAQIESKDETEIITELLVDGLERRADWDKAMKLAGSLKLPKTFDNSRRQQIRERNWRP